MKKVLKSIGATLGYLAVYFLVTILVTIAAILIHTVQAVLEAFKTGPSFIDFISGDLINYIGESAMTITFISGLFTLLCLWLIIKIRKKRIKDRLDLKPVPWSKLWPVLPLGAALNILISYIIDFLPIPEQLLEEYAQSSSFLDGGSTIVLILTAVIMAPILEEVLLRGLILKSLQGSMPIAVAIVIQSVIFGLLHGQIIWISYAAVLGIILGLVKVRYQSLFACILLHFSFNASSLFVGSLMEMIQSRMILIILVFVISAVSAAFLCRMILKATKPVIAPAEDLSGESGSASIN